jgi:predicted MFS family arabinose efflux permease
MTDTVSQANEITNPFDSWKSIVISLYMTLVGYGVLVGIPVISTAWVTLLGFSEIEVGRVAGADLGGLSLGAVVTAIFIAKTNRRVLALIGMFFAVTANAMCITVVDYDQVLWLRLLSGFGSGIFTAVAVSSLGASSKPAMAYNAMLFAFAFSQALEMHFLPLLSMAGVYMVFIVCFLLTLPFLGWIPSYANIVQNNLTELSSEEDEKAKALKNIPPFVPWLCLAAMVVTYTNIGAYWTYIELAALSDKADPEWVGWVLTGSSFFSLVGCLFATVLSNRYGLLRPLLVTLATMAVIVGMLANGITDKNIIISVFSFNFLWIFIDVYQMSTIANVDRVGRFAALMPGAQGLGQIIGPNIAASILGLNLGYSGVFVMCSAAALVAMALYAFMYLRFKDTVPAFAYAS